MHSYLFFIILMCSDLLNPSRYAMGTALSAMIVTTVATVITFVFMIKYMCDSTNDRCKRSFYNRYLPWFLWMLSSLIFSGTIITRIVATKSKMDGWYIALISTMANWSNAGFIIWTIVREVRNALLTISKIETNKKSTVLAIVLYLCFLILELILLLIPLLAPVIIIYAFSANIFGSDDASLLTGYSYINTLTESINRINFVSV
jgi:hypothetical protein